MIVYGVALLGACLLLGSFSGQLIGQLIGVQANVGGVGIAMLALILIHNASGRRFSLAPETAKGITFWSAMYIPIVIAMAAKQNVFSAINSGWVSVFAGVIAVVLSFAMVPVLVKIGSKHSQIVSGQDGSEENEGEAG